MMNSKIDWLSFTFKVDADPLTQYKAFWKAFPELLGLEDSGVSVSFKGEHSDRFYNNVLVFNDFMRVSYRDMPFNSDSEEIRNRNLGVNVSIPAHGLEWFFGLFDLKNYSADGIVFQNDVQKMFHLLKSRFCSVSRLDIAYDDFDKILLPCDWERFRIDKCIVSNFKKFYYASSERNCGDTFYIGKRSAGKICRIYDKNYESNGEIDAIRYEFEFHSKYAGDYVDYVIKFGHLPAFDDVFKRFIIRVVEPGYCRIDAGKDNKVYTDFIKAVKLSFSEELTYTKFVNTTDKLMRSVRWLAKSVGPKLKLFVQTFGYEALCLLIENSNCSAADELLRSNYFLNDYYYDAFLENQLEGIDHYFQTVF